MTASQVERSQPSQVSDERTMLDGWLDYHRATLLQKCAGLNDEQLRRRSCAPSTLSLLGLVRHMAEVERSWFQRRVAGRELRFLYCDVESNPDGDFDDVDTADTWEAFATYRRTCDEVRAAAADATLDDMLRDGDSRCSVRWVYLHMIEEYARHNGHADLLRQRIDGATGS
jgi:uncharacterized damage-inducible protein DinB